MRAPTTLGVSRDRLAAGTRALCHRQDCASADGDIYDGGTPELMVMVVTSAASAMAALPAHTKRMA